MALLLAKARRTWQMSARRRTARPPKFEASPMFVVKYLIRGMNRMADICNSSYGYDRRSSPGKSERLWWRYFLKERALEFPDDPVRRLITERTKALEISHAELSRMIGRGASYINQFLRRGSPVHLDDREAALVAQILKVHESDIRIDEAIAKTQSPMARAKTLPRADRRVAVFNEDSEIDFDKVSEWVDCPMWVTLSEQSFALWIAKRHPGLKAGDLAFVTAGRPLRPQDIVVLLTMDQRTLVDIGTITELSSEKVIVAVDGDPEKSFHRRGHVILRVAAVLFG
jgi:hypothetical protein